MDLNTSFLGGGAAARLAIFAVFLVIAARIVFSKGTGRGVATFFAVRYSLLVGVFFLAMPFLFMSTGRSMFGTTFVLPMLAEVGLVTFFIVTAAWVVMASWYLTLRHAPERLPDLAPPPGGAPAFAEKLVSSRWRRLFFTTFLATPPIAATIAASELGRPVVSFGELAAALVSASALPYWGAVAGGVALGLALLYLNYSVFRVIQGTRAESFELLTDIFSVPAPVAADRAGLLGRLVEMLRGLDTVLMALIEPLVRFLALVLRVLTAPIRILWRAFARAADLSTSEFGPGYFGADGRLYPAHRFGVLQLGVLGVIYVVAGFAFSPFIGQAERYSLPVIGYMAILAMILTYGFAAVAYFFDHWRFPTLIAVGLAVYLLGLFPSIDHYYGTRPRAECEGCDWASLTPDEAVGAWWTAEGCAVDPPMIAVAASGGGIRAGAWTVEILTALEEMYGAPFVRSFSSISSVSGGSVGAVQYLLDYPVCAPRTPERLEEIRRSTASDSLRATAWGIVYPDFLRIAFAPLFELWPRAENWDRAAATEAAWRASTGSADPETTLGQWRAAVRRGHRPISLINTTTVETGETFIMAPIDIDPATEGLQGVPSFFHEYSSHDVQALTAARMSATFPWVSPVARPRLALQGGDTVTGTGTGAGDDEPRISRPFYLADGGYFDNFGVATLIRWLTAIVPGFMELEPRAAGAEGPKRLMLLLIRDSTPVPAERRRFTQERGFRYELTGPIETMLNSRGSTQDARNANELLLFEELWRLAALAEDANVEVTQVNFRLDNRVAREVSLSWSLTEHEVGLLKGALCEMVDEARAGGAGSNNPFAAVGDYLGVDVTTAPRPRRCADDGTVGETDGTTDGTTEYGGG